MLGSLIFLYFISTKRAYLKLFSSSCFMLLICIALSYCLFNCSFSTFRASLLIWNSLQSSFSCLTAAALALPDSSDLISSLSVSIFSKASCLILVSCDNLFPQQISFFIVLLIDCLFNLRIISIKCT